MSTSKTGIAASFCKYKLFLNKFNYPNISWFNDEQIIDIFNSKNRFFLLSWIIKPLMPELILPTVWSETTISLFADFFHDSGFCKSSEKYAFVEGDLNIKQQIIVFDRIFNSDYYDIESLEKVDNTYSFDAFLKVDINLFPKLGPLKLFDSCKRQQKIEQYKQEIKKLEVKLASIPNEGHINTIHEITSDEGNTNLDNIRKLADKLKEVVCNIKEFNKQSRVFKSIDLVPQIKLNLENCIDELIIILKYFENVNLSHNFIYEGIPDTSQFDSGEVLNLLEYHAESSSEFINLLKSEQNDS